MEAVSRPGSVPAVTVTMLQIYKVYKEEECSMFQEQNHMENEQNINPNAAEGRDKKKKRNGKGRFFLKLTSGVLAFGLTAGLSVYGVSHITENYLEKKFGKTSAEAVKEEKLSGEESGEIEKAAAVPVSNRETSGVAEIVQNVMPSIVSINCSSVVSQNFFGQQLQQEQKGSGSGIIIGDNQDEVLIVTNNHVVEGNQAKVSVQFYDGTECAALIKGTDAGSDLAVVAVKLSDLSEDTKKVIKIATLGSSDETKVGEVAIAIGNALGYGQSVTVGYISAKDRTIEIADSARTTKLLQTDAAINPGNSGGALINSKGEIIGINSAKYSDTAVEGIGYAIPITEALPIIKALMNSEEVAPAEKAYLGIIGADVNETARQVYHMPEGVYIKEVSEGSPAEKAGVHAGAIITECNGNKITSMENLEKILSASEPGDEVELTLQEIFRGEYSEKQITVILGSNAE